MVNNDFEYVHKKIESIESNMATKSDISHFENMMSATDNLAKKLDDFTQTVNKLIIQNERREESDKHRDKEVERAIKLSIENQKDIQLIKQKDAEKAPYYRGMERAMLAVITVAAVGIAGLVFK